MGWLLWLWVDARAEDWAALREDSGWEAVADRHTDLGTVAVSRRWIDDMWCLRAQVDTDVSADTLMATLWDVSRAPEWSSNPLKVSEVLVPGDAHMVFWQHLDIAGWTLIHDRYWVLDVEALAEPHALGFRWQRVDAAQTWPDVVRRAQAWDSGAMQPPLMWGEWRFETGGPKTHVIWRGCQDIGGSVPRWIQAWAGASALPDAVGDLVHAAARR